MKDLNAITSDPNVKTLFDPVTAAEMLRIDPKEKFLAPPVVLSISDNSGTSIPSFTSGNFSLIIGKAKSKKTFLITLLIASFLGYKNKKIIANSNANHKVLWFDTEQSPYHLGAMLKRVCSLIGNSNPMNLNAYQLRTLMPDERIQLIEYLISVNPAGLVIIDGIRDLVTDINSPDQATRTATLLMRWSAENDTHIINVLHQNKGDGNARGHLGTELTNKAETVLSVTVDGGVSVVEAEYTRDREFKPFSFLINEDSLPELCELPTKEGEFKKCEPHLIADDIHEDILTDAFKDAQTLSYTNTWRTIKASSEKFGYFFGDNKAKNFLNWYLSKGWITKDGGSSLYRISLPV